MSRIITLDPGKITGVATGWFSDVDPLTVRSVHAIEYSKIVTPAWWDWVDGQFDVVVSEKFELRNNDFAADLHPVRIEGMMDLMLPYRVVYRSPALKSQVKDDILKEHGLWKTGKDVDWEDGRDVNDALIHMIGHVAFTMKHVPTLRKYFR